MLNVKIINLFIKKYKGAFFYLEIYLCGSHKKKYAYINPIILDKDWCLLAIIVELKRATYN